MKIRNKSILIVAGEASGDLHGANLIHALKSLMPEVDILGIGGPRMRRAGLKSIYPTERLSVVGITEVIGHLRDIWLARKRIKTTFNTSPPSLFIPIDYPDFNLHIAKIAKENGIPVLYYISPQVWAWRRSRVKKIANLVDEMVVILPFEKGFYKKYNVKVNFVGHPLLDIIPEPKNVSQPTRLLMPEHSDGGQVIGLMPGSRLSEVKRILPIMIETSKILRQKRPDLRFALPVAPTLDIQWLKKKFDLSKIALLKENNYQAMRRCLFLLVASGTATLEAAILLKPFIIIYRLSVLSYFLGKRLVDIPYIGLVNWVAEKKIIPEFLQNEARPENVAEAAFSLLENSEKLRQIKESLKVVRKRLGTPGASQRVAQLAKNILEI